MDYKPFYPSLLLLKGTFFIRDIDGVFQINQTLLMHTVVQSFFNPVEMAFAIIKEVLTGRNTLKIRAQAYSVTLNDEVQIYRPFFKGYRENLIRTGSTDFISKQHIDSYSEFVTIPSQSK